MIYTAIYFSKKSHIQKRIGVSLPVKLASFVCFETHVPVKSHGRRVLFVDGNLTHTEIFHGICQKLLSDSPPTHFRGNEQHFEAVFFGAHKGNRLIFALPRGKKAGNALQSIGHIFLYFKYLVI